VRVWGPSVGPISPPMELVALVPIQSLDGCGEPARWPPPPAIPSNSNGRCPAPEGQPQPTRVSRQPARKPEEGYVNPLVQILPARHSFGSGGEKMLCVLEKDSCL